MFLLPSKKTGKKKKGKKKKEKRKKKKRKKKSLVSTLTPTRRVLCLASALLFVIHLHGMMFALAGGAVAVSLAREWVRAGSCWYPVVHGAGMLSPWSWEVLGCWDVEGVADGRVSGWQHAGGGSKELSAESAKKKSFYGAASCWQGDEVHGLIGLFHFNFYSKMTLCCCSQTQCQPFLTPHTRSFFLFCPSLHEEGFKANKHKTVRNRGKIWTGPLITAGMWKL